MNKFLSEHPSFQYRPLQPSLFDECLRVEQLWRQEKHYDNPDGCDTVAAEQRVMETIFAHWDELGMLGGSIYLGDRMIAFSYGSAVTDDTFDVSVEKADRTIDGAFSIINQQLCAHLPQAYRYINREEDMGLEGLRKAKLSYHPYQLLTYNILQIT